jgi:hypothetical protein
MSAQAQLFPGVYFETVQPPPVDVLPRMDIASFVGFACTGPLHTPIAVESAQQFREIFGADLSLAWDTERNQVDQSYLGLSVETFFRNGGRRCWVVRVADEQMAQTAQFAIPGLIRSNGIRVEQAYADARSPGAWAERVETSSVLQAEQLQLITGDEELKSEPSLQINASDWYVDVIANDTQVESGDLISVNFFRDKSLVYLIVESVTAIEQGIRMKGSQGYFYTRDVNTSPAAFDESLAITATDDSTGFLLFKLSDLSALGFPGQWPPASPQDEMPSIRLLRFELLTHGPERQQQRISSLGFVAGQNRFWGVLPSDENLFRQDEGQIIKKYSNKTQALLEEVSIPRFPLAAPGDAENWHYLPNDMSLLVNVARQSDAEFSSEVDRLRREGIKNFGAQIFLDERLQNMRGDLLKQEANAIAFLSDSHSSRKLKGLHSLLLIDEATLIAVPDAIHRRWDATPPPFELPLQAPQLLEINDTEVVKEHRVSWTPVSDSVTYTLEWSKYADFTEVTRKKITGDSLPRVGESLDLLPEPATDYLLAIHENCPLTYYFRVRAERAGEISTWSNNKAKLIPESDFLDCQYARAEALELTLAVASEGTSPITTSPAVEGHLLQWDVDLFQDETESEDYLDYFELQQACDRLFGDTKLIFSGAYDELTDPDNPAFFVEESPDSTFYYRVRAIRRETIGPWSNTLTLWPGHLSQTTLQSVSDFSNSDVLAIHRALLRCCYARGDLFGVLSLPHHYKVQNTLEHYALLKPTHTLDNIQSSGETTASDSFGASVPALTTAEESATTHCALYYPWLATPTESNGQGRVDIRMLPPDGPIVGKIAARTIARGAWIASANSPLTDVLALANEITDAQWARLTRSRINVIRQEARGFLLLSSNTLSANSELAEINVRRLMSLLLRLALREGNRYVFEPNDAVFQEQVQQHFETVFARLFDRGAFAGRTASQAYRVVTDSSVNTLQSIEAGRFIVELRVAPSRALKFMRVRLMQSGPSQLQVQEL